MSSALADRLRLIVECDYFAFEGDKEAVIEAAKQLDAAPTPFDVEALASAMRKVLPPVMLEALLEHLDPLTPFMKVIRETR